MDSGASPSPTRHFWSMVSGMLRQAAAIAVVGTAFFCYAGYTYLDHLYRQFGLAYGATAPATAEVIGWGYLVTLYAAIQTIQSWLVIWAWEVVGILPVIGLIILVAIKSPSFRNWIIEKCEAHHSHVKLASARILFCCACFMILFAAGPWGSSAAKIQTAFI